MIALVVSFFSFFNALRKLSIKLCWQKQGSAKNNNAEKKEALFIMKKFSS
jgi:hypothetical protein